MPPKTVRARNSEWHGQVLAVRKAKVDSGEAQFLSIEQLKERLHH
jgi:hypothetical protein